MSGEITSSGRRAVPAVVTVLVSVLVVAVAGFFLLSGNGSGTASPASGTPTTSAPVSTSPSPSATKLDPPELPAAAKEATPQGAAAFFRFYWETFNYSYASLDTEALGGLSTDTCRSCDSYVSAIDAARVTGNRFTGGEVRVIAAVAAPGDVDRGLVVNAVISQEQAYTVTADGATADAVEATTRQRIDAAVAWRKERWVMLGMDTREN